MRCNLNKKNLRKFEKMLRELSDWCGETIPDSVYDDSAMVLSVPYEFATIFAKSTAVERKVGILLRRRLIECEGLRKIALSKCQSRIDFHFGNHGTEKIEFTLPETILRKSKSWLLERCQVLYEISLTPWFHQKQFLKLRESLLEARYVPFSAVVSFYHTTDFGSEELYDRIAKGEVKRPRTYGELEKICLDSCEMDFSDFMRERREEYYRDCLREIQWHFNGKEGQSPFLAVINDASLYHNLSEDVIEKHFTPREGQDSTEIIRLIEKHQPFSERPLDFQALPLKSAR